VLQRSPTAWSAAVVDAAKAALKYAQDWLGAHARQLMACAGLILGACLAVGGRPATAELTWQHGTGKARTGAYGDDG
jgi:hypothetical protein